MIELNEKTQQDFLNREWVQKLLDAGADLSDAKYWIVKTTNSLNDGLKDYIVDNKGLLGVEPAWDDNKHSEQKKLKKLPTYTTAELLYKLHEYICPTIDGQKYSGTLTFLKDAPFYIFYYHLTNGNGSGNSGGLENDEYISAPCEYPIESLASLLLQCHKKDIGTQYKDTGNINDK